jgi:hypothetical protein
VRRELEQESTLICVDVMDLAKLSCVRRNPSGDPATLKRAGGYGSRLICIRSIQNVVGACARGARCCRYCYQMQESCHCPLTPELSRAAAAGFPRPIIAMRMTEARSHEAASA